MKSKVKSLIKFVCFFIVTCVLVLVLNQVLMPKRFFNSAFPTTNTYEDFYKLKKNSVDVLFFGSSHAVCSFNPQIIYDTYGITSYNLASEQQSLVVTYYWLREALKYQSPKAVVLDTYILHKYIDAYVANDLNCSETAVRKAMDSMRFSPLKIEAAKTIAEIDPTQSWMSYILLNIRYHSRWSDLREDDFIQLPMYDHGGVKGFTVFGGSNPNLENTPFTAEEASEAEPENMMAVSKEYLDKIVELCKEKNIQLILTKIPCDEPIGRYKSTSDYAEEHALPFYDFNEAELYTAIDYDAPQDMLSHPSYRGANKVSLYLGKLLRDEYKIESRVDESYDMSRELYNHKLNMVKLMETTDIHEYLKILDNDAYSVFVFAPNFYGELIDDEVMKELSALGFGDIKNAETLSTYCAVKEAGASVSASSAGVAGLGASASDAGITEQIFTDDLDWKGSVRGGLTLYEFKVDTSILMKSYHKYSLKVADEECCIKNRGINIAVFDNELKLVIDKVNFDTTQEGLPASRK